MNCSETRNLAHAYVDKEIDLVRAMEIEKHLDGCAACKALFAQEGAMQSAVRERASYYAAPRHLEARIRAALPGRAKKSFIFRPPDLSWLSLATSMAVAVFITWGVAVHFNTVSEDERLSDQIISGHVRSLMANHLADVESSDKHTVKPWFNGKLDFSPEVLDTAAEGFPLVGGRLDYINDRPVAALVYKHRKHFINLFVWPEEPGAKSTLQTKTKQGYNLIYWKNSGMVFWAISDLDEKELMQFVNLLQPAAKQ
ncbi:MAG TPA: anti-sigma factor [Burkholderiales bacterium]|nr:anti-sigma factor [Burkholderiales bacterium]